MSDILIPMGATFKCPVGHEYATANRDVALYGIAKSAHFDFADGQIRGGAVQCYCGRGIWAIQRLTMNTEDRARFDAWVKESEAKGLL